MDIKPTEIFEVDTIEGLDHVVDHLLISPTRKFMFYGNLGAGKTTLIKALCARLGVTEATTSPTYALINKYQTASTEVIHHADLYRLESLEDAIDVGIEDLLYDDNYCFIEWPEVIESIIPDKVGRLAIVITPEGKRKINFFL